MEPRTRRNAWGEGLGVVTAFAEKGENSDQLNQNIVMGGAGDRALFLFICC